MGSSANARAEKFRRLPFRTRARLDVLARKSAFARRLMIPVGEYIRIKELSGLPLLIAALAALVWANGPWADSYRAVWNHSAALELFGFRHEATFGTWVNEVLLPMLFFVAGLEIKREVVRGELSEWDKALLPILLAVGGVVAPAAIYLGFSSLGAPIDGWGVPIATDVAFSLAVFLALGDRIPRDLKILLLTVAAVDDLLGVLVIALFYSASELDPRALASLAGLFFLAIAVRGLRGGLAIPIVILGMLMWIASVDAGLHPTVMAVGLGLLAPARPLFPRPEFDRELHEASEVFSRLQAERDQLPAQPRDEPDPQRRARLREINDEEEIVLARIEQRAAATEAVTDRLTRALNPWVSYVALPIFALANGGLAFRQIRLTEPAQLWTVVACASGLLVGKPVGIVVSAWLGTRLRIARRPNAVSWSEIIGMGLVAGIGFSVSLFIADLAFADPGLLAAAKFGVFVASLGSGLLAYTWLRLRLPRTRAEAGSPLASESAHDASKNASQDQRQDTTREHHDNEPTDRPGERIRDTGRARDA